MTSLCDVVRLSDSLRSDDKHKEAALYLRRDAQHDKHLLKQPLKSTTTTTTTPLQATSSEPNSKLCDEDSAACSSEVRRRQALFEVQRLMLQARPYDSIEFFHMQREVLSYLELGSKEGKPTPRPGGSKRGWWGRLLRGRARRSDRGHSSCEDMNINTL